MSVLNIIKPTSTTSQPSAHDILALINKIEAHEFNRSFKEDHTESSVSNNGAQTIISKTFSPDFHTTQEAVDSFFEKLNTGAYKAVTNPKRMTMGTETRFLLTISNTRESLDALTQAFNGDVMEASQKNLVTVVEKIKFGVTEKDDYLGKEEGAIFCRKLLETWAEIYDPSQSNSLDVPGPFDEASLSALLPRTQEEATQTIRSLLPKINTLYSLEDFKARRSSGFKGHVLSMSLIMKEPLMWEQEGCLHMQQPTKKSWEKSSDAAVEKKGVEKNFQEWQRAFSRDVNLLEISAEEKGEDLSPGCWRRIYYLTEASIPNTVESARSLKLAYFNALAKGLLIGDRDNRFNVKCPNEVGLVFDEFYEDFQKREGELSSPVAKKSLGAAVSAAVDLVLT